VCVCVSSRNLNNEDAYAQLGLLCYSNGGSRKEEGAEGRHTIAVHLGLSAELMLQNTWKRVNIGHNTTPTLVVNMHYNNYTIKYNISIRSMTSLTPASN
jgi:hypothetical protein